MAVKADAHEQLFLNANTSSTIFYSAKLNLVHFYSQVVHGYTLHANGNYDRLTIEPTKVDDLKAILNG
ncbi:hypothetical protein PENTCL1PPCAC_29184, partial [Pristionchus entomophagus]